YSLPSLSFPPLCLRPPLPLFPYTTLFRSGHPVQRAARLPIVAGAEGLADSSENDHPGPRFVLDLVKQICELFVHPECKGVHRVGTVNGDALDACDGLVDSEIVGHVTLSYLHTHSSASSP